MSYSKNLKALLKSVHDTKPAFEFHKDCPPATCFGRPDSQSEGNGLTQRQNAHWYSAL